jgi:hypothetical protein
MKDMICKTALMMFLTLWPCLLVQAQSLEELAEKQKALIAERNSQRLAQPTATSPLAQSSEPKQLATPAPEHSIDRKSSSGVHLPNMREFPTIASSEELPSPVNGTLVRGTFVVRLIRPHSTVKGRFNVLLTDISGRQFALEGIAASAASAVVIGQKVYAKRSCPLEIIGMRPPSLFLVRPYVGWLDDQP